MIGGIEVKLLQKRIAFGTLGQVQRLEMLGQPAAQFGFSAADGTFDDDITVVHNISLLFTLLVLKHTARPSENTADGFQTASRSILFRTFIQQADT